MSLVVAFVVVVSLLLVAQALFSLWLNIYTWDHPERMAVTQGPSSFQRPELAFTVLLPARHEEAVIAETIRKVASTDYPSDLLEIRVVCHEDDEGTIAAAERAVVAGGFLNAGVETFAGTVINKPRGLNIGLERTSHEVVCIFDAEDDVHPDIFNVVNTVMLEERVGVVQAGVQLINARDRWFSVHNCLEYFFWFKSRLHFHANVGMVPLGGNTVFMRRDLVERVGGWDEACLTEDADIGIRLSALGERIRVVYHPEWVTQEETPQSISALIKQRTRWHQGFLQVLGKGDWRRLPGWPRRVLALLTLGAPLMDAALVSSLPFVIAASLFVRVPVPVALLSLAPLYAVMFQAAASSVAVLLFAKDFGIKLPIRTLLRLPLTYLPYQWLLGVSAVRAVARQVQRQSNWEKTEHVGAHRIALPGVSLQPLPEFADAA